MDALFLLTVCLIGAVTTEVAVLSYGLLVVVPRVARSAASDAMVALSTQKGRAVAASVILDVIENLDLKAISADVSQGAAPVLSQLIDAKAPLIRGAVQAGVSSASTKAMRRFSRDPIGAGMEVMGGLVMSKLAGGLVPGEGGGPLPAPPASTGVPYGP